MLRRLQMRGAARPGSYQNQEKGAAMGLTNPITGIAGCCARAASGHAAAALPTRLMKSRRLM